MYGDFLSMLGWIGGGYRVRRDRDELEGVDLDAEYELIQKKKSNLSRRLREEVVRRVERREH